MVNFWLVGIRGFLPREESEFDLPDYEDDVAQSGVDPTDLDPAKIKSDEPYDYGADFMGRR